MNQLQQSMMIDDLVGTGITVGVSGAENSDQEGVVSYFRPATNGNGKTPKVDKKFHKDFLRAINGQGEGLLTAYLFWDENANSEVSVGAPENGGGKAWDNIAGSGQKKRGSVCVPDEEEGLGVGDDDMDAIQYSIDEGLITKLPKNIKLVEYGGGGKTGFRKPKLVLDNMDYQEDDSEFNICCAVEVDILTRYTNESAAEFSEMGLYAFGVTGNFMFGDRRLQIPDADPEFTPVVMVFGGPLENAPDIHNGKKVSQKESASVYYARMNKQHGIGSYLLKTYNAEKDPVKIKKKYLVEQFTPFLLSVFQRAKSEGIIIDKEYDALENWEMEEAIYNSQKERSELSIISKKDHEIPICNPDGTRDTLVIKKGHRINSILSSRWDAEAQGKVLDPAGYEVVADYRRKGSSGGVLLAKAVREPSPDLLS